MTRAADLAVLAAQAGVCAPVPVFSSGTMPVFRGGIRYAKSSLLSRVRCSRSVDRVHALLLPHRVARPGRKKGRRQPGASTLGDDSKRNPLASRSRSSRSPGGSRVAGTPHPADAPAEDRLALSRDRTEATPIAERAGLILTNPPAGSP